MNEPSIDALNKCDAIGHSVIFIVININRNSLFCIHKHLYLFKVVCSCQ